MDVIGRNNPRERPRDAYCRSRMSGATLATVAMIGKLARRVLQAARRKSAGRTRLANIAHLLTGNFLGSLLALVAFTLSARALGVTNYGELALIIAFTRVVERVVSFQSWQPIIKYAAGMNASEGHENLRVLMKFGLLIDVGAAVCAWVVAIGAALLIAPVFGWSTQIVHLLVLYSSVLLFQISGVPVAVQRMAGNFRLLAYGQLLNAVLRVLLCLLGVLINGDLAYFTAVWAGTQILGSLALLTLTMRALHRQGVHNVLGAPLAGITRRFPGIWDFAWSSNISLTLRASAQELDTLLVGWLADPASAGLYQIAKRIGRVGQQVGPQVQNVLYPDVARLWAKGSIEEFKRVIFQTEAMLLCFGVICVLVVAVLIRPLLAWTAGPEFIGAASLVIVQMVAVTFVLSGSAARSALLAMGRQREVLRIVVVATAAFHVTALLLIPRIGAMGGNIAHIVLGILWAFGLALSLRQALKTAHHPDRQTPPADALNQASLAPSKAI
ncbi:lipopolysaccharide biosynthesis protein [Mesorhizobium sp. CA13]|nr:MULTISPECIES: lipopolysaccharide biosynthesis protein [unclassified Mesorhizobium]MBZ9856945.1 lipopolysaccharide biosynthesis protein [Mesorhizobium sp. CA13]MBZ9966493.1 lipopolysaccharide biosynthesis protein [Mesorhizobium sp. BR1-1-2]